MVADLIPPGLVVADIGTDHAFLPVHLVRQGICARAVASDIEVGPLRNAAKNIKRAGLDETIELRQSDGFVSFAATDAQCWVLAGMGGTLMVRLLEAAPWLCQPDTVIVAQPMSRDYELRDWFISHGFIIEQEAVCRDTGRSYLALRAVYGGQVKGYSPGYAYYGELLHNKSVLSHEYLLRERELLRVRLQHDAQLKGAYDDFCAKHI